MKKKAIGHLVKTNPIQSQTKPIAERVKLMQSVYLQRIMKKNADKGYEKTKPKQTQNKANFRQEMLKMPYLPACVKRHYAGTVKAMQPGTVGLRKGKPFAEMKLGDIKAGRIIVSGKSL